MLAYSARNRSASIRVPFVSHLVAEYSELKRRLAVEHAHSIEEYQNGKEAFIRAVERKALQWRRSA